MSTRFTGGCMCGAIRYECSAEPIATPSFRHLKTLLQRTELIAR